FASCDLLSGDKPGDTKVIFRAFGDAEDDLGVIELVGNTFISAAVLNTHINTPRKFLGLDVGGLLNLPMVDNDVSKLEEYYKTFGYLNVRVSRELRYLSGGTDVVIVFHIDEGIRYRFKDSPKVTNAKSLPVEEVEHLTKIKPGTYYSQIDVERDLNAIKAYYGYRGLENEAQASPACRRDSPGVVTMNYEIEQKAPARVGQIFIVGNTRTRQNVILRQIPLYPGQILTYPDLRLAERNLQRLNIFA